MADANEWAKWAEDAATKIAAKIRELSAEIDACTDPAEREKLCELRARLRGGYHLLHGSDVADFTIVHKT